MSGSEYSDLDQMLAEEQEPEQVAEVEKPESGLEDFISGASDAEEGGLQFFIDTAKAEEIKEEKQKELKELHKIQDEKLKALQHGKEQKKQEKFITESMNAKEEYSGLLVRQGTRQMSQDELSFEVKNRKFIDLLNIESITDKTGALLVRSYFTVGVLIEKTPPIKSKSGKLFSIWKLSDMQKYDPTALKKKLGSTEEGKMTLKSFNPNNYKTAKFMIFNELTTKLQNTSIGTVIALLNPKPMKPTTEHGFSYCIDLQEQVLKIGMSEEFAMCSG